MDLNNASEQGRVNHKLDQSSTKTSDFTTSFAEFFYFIVSFYTETPTGGRIHSAVLGRTTQVPADVTKIT